MDVVNVMRFTIAAEEEERMIEQRTTLLEAVRKITPGLLRAILTRVDDETWMDVWHWDSQETLVAVQTAQLPEAKASFAMVTPVDSTLGRLVSIN